MKSVVLMPLIAVSALATAHASRSEEPEPHRFVYLGSGRFAQYADLSTLTPESPDTGRIRVFQVADAQFRAGGAAYWGGWSWWRFDCRKDGPVDRLDFASVREGGAEGPATPDPAPPYPALEGGDAFELVVAACNPEEYDIDATTLEEAVRHGREQLAL